MCKEYRVILLSIIFAICFNIPIFYLKLSIINNIVSAFLLEMLIIIPITIILFYVLLMVPYIGTMVISMLCIMGYISNFFIFTFKKSFDPGVLEDLLSVEASLTMEYMNIYLVFSSIIGFFIICFLISKYINRAQSIGLWRVLSILLLLVMIVCGASNGFSRLPLASTFNYYFPFNIIYTVKTYYKNQKFQSELLRNKRDLTKEYTFKTTSEDPLIVVLIIGESMRGDLVSKATMPLLLNRPNVVNFSNARSFETSTRLSIPYMLTSAGKSNFDRSLGEKSIISIFKHLGFSTSWVGNQGLFGVFETSFASIALESDNIIVKKDVRQAFPHEKIQDEHLLPFFDNAINADYKKKFIVTHLLGSHYQFYERIPENFKRPFLPECKSWPSECPKDVLLNSYYNTLYYSDIVLDQMLTKLEDKNAIVIYASDHGMSLGEGGYFGNAYQGDNTPKEQLDIAMFAWASDKFIKNNPSYLNAQTHEKSLVNHGYIFHSLLDCTGVESEYIDNNLSLCRKRK